MRRGIGLTAEDGLQCPAQGSFDYRTAPGGGQGQC